MPRQEKFRNATELAHYLYAQWAWFMRDHTGTSDTRRTPTNRSKTVYPVWEDLSPIEQLAWEHTAQQTWGLL